MAEDWGKNWVDPRIILKGSPLRDKYKYEHKQYANYLSPQDRDKCLGLDIDFVEIRDFEIICFTDIKRFDEGLTPIEKIVYPKLEKIAPVLEIETNDDLSEFGVKLLGTLGQPKQRYSRRDYFNEFLPHIQEHIAKLKEATKLASYM